VTRRAVQDPAQLSWFDTLVAPLVRVFSPPPASAPLPAVSVASGTTFAPAPSSARDSAAFLERLRALGMRGIDRLVLTKNRTVMVSVARGVLRVHNGFVGAPDDIARAIATFVTTRDRAAQRRAHATITTWPLPPDAVLRRPRATPQHPDDAGMAQRLTELHGALNLEHFGGALSPLEIRVCRRLARRLGHYAIRRGEPHGEIVISRRHIRRDGWTEATHTLLHEMVHQWQDENGLPVDHGAAFRRKCRSVGIHPGAVRQID
jgi:hypothetical protein